MSESTAYRLLRAQDLIASPAFIVLTSNSSIYFECVANWAHIYVGSSTYSVDFLEDKAAGTYTNYIGPLAA